MKEIMQPAVYSVVLQLKIWLSTLLALLACNSMNKEYEINALHFQIVISTIEKGLLFLVKKNT